MFGSVCHVLAMEKLRSKLEKKAHRCIFIRYDMGRKGWRCCNPSTYRCYTSQDVVFNKASSLWSPEATMLPSSENLEENFQRELSTEDDMQDAEEEKPSKESQTPQKRPSQESQTTQGRSTSSLRSGVQEYMTPKEARPSQLEIDDPPQQLQRSNSVKKPNPKYIDADLAQIEDVPTPTLDQETGRTRERTRKSKLRKTLLSGRNVR